VANLVQSATVNGNWMTGVQGYETAGGATGCFGGTLATTTAAAAAASTAKADPAAAK
jgi:hypothetical protein